MTLPEIAARSVLRSKLRSSLTVVGGAVAIVAFILLRTVVSAWGIASTLVAQDRLATRNSISVMMPMPMRYIDTVRGVDGVKAATFINFFGARNPNDPNNSFENLAVDARSYFEVYNELQLAPEQMTQWLEDRQGAVIGDLLAERLGVKVGDPITLTGTNYPGDWQFRIRGIFTSDRASADRSVFLFHWDYMNNSLSESQRDRIHWIMSRVDGATLGAATSERIDQIFDEKDIQTLTMSERALGLTMMGEVSTILAALDAVSIIVLMIMGLILGNTIAMGVRERTREYGALRAIGFSPRHIYTFIVGEAVAMAMLSAVFGLLLAYPVVEWWVGAWLQENMVAFFPSFHLDKTAALMALGLAVALGAISALVPARTVANLSVADALRRVN